MVQLRHHFRGKGPDRQKIDDVLMFAQRPLNLDNQAVVVAVQRLDFPGPNVIKCPDG